MPTRSASPQFTFEPPELHEIELEVVDDDIVIMRINRPSPTQTSPPGCSR